MTSHEIREKLQNLGFVRVDGLQTNHHIHGSAIIKAEPQLQNKYDSHHDGMASFTFTEEVWLGYADPRYQMDREELAEELGMKKGGVVPCSLGEVIAPIALLKRIRYPDWKPEYPPA